MALTEAKVTSIQTAITIFFIPISIGNIYSQASTRVMQGKKTTGWQNS